MSRRSLSILTVLVLVTVLGGGIWWRLKPEPEETNEAEASEPDDTLQVEVAGAASQFGVDVATPVEGAEVVRDTLWVTVSATGSAEAYREVVVAPRVAGPIEEILVRENSYVAEGQPLVQLDTTELAMAHAQARSGLLNAQADYRVAMLRGGDITDPEVRANREANARASSGLNNAEVAIRQAEMDLERSTIRAPFGGRIANLQVVRGQHVSAGAELMTLVDVNPIKVEANVLQSGIAILEEGRRAFVTFTAFPDEEFIGRVESINPVLDDETSTGRVTILLDNPEGRIKPGMYADARIEARGYPDRLIVPRSAVLERDRAGLRVPIVFVYNERNGQGFAEWRYITPGEENDRYVEIIPSEEGTVEPGEIVLIGGHHYISHDHRIELVESAVAAGGRPGR